MARESQKPNIIGTYIKEKRTEAGLRLQDIADDAQVATSTVSRIEHGELLPTVDVLVRILEVLPGDPAELLAQLGITSPRPLPVLAQYLREKYHLSDEQIDRISTYFREMVDGKDNNER